jgi:hypothetical protein
LLLWLLMKIAMKIFVNRSQESLEENSWVPIAMLCSQYWKILKARAPNILMWEIRNSEFFSLHANHLTRIVLVKTLVL